MIPGARFKRLAAICRQGIWLWRGLKPEGVPPNDPGDLGAGTYWTSCRSRARCFGPTVIKQWHQFRNPLVLDVGAAYDLGDQFALICDGRAAQQQRALQMREWLKAQGHDALVAVREPRDRKARKQKFHTELEVVDLR